MAKNWVEFEAFIASIPVFMSSVTKPKHWANLEGRGQGADFEARFDGEKMVE